MHPNKPRRPNNGMNGGNARHHNNNNRQRRFNNGGRPDDSANAARVRRHAQQQREKYQNMARDAMSMGDRVLAENYLQHADHFHRVILSLPPEEQPRQHHQHRQHSGEEGAPQQEGDHAQEAQSSAAMDMNEPQPMPSADALPSFITQQPIVNHPPQNFEE